MIIRLAVCDTGYAAFLYEEGHEPREIGKGTSPDEALGHAIREMCIRGRFNRNLRKHPTDGSEHQCSVNIDVVLMDN